MHDMTANTCFSFFLFDNFSTSKSTICVDIFTDWQTLFLPVLIESIYSTGPA